MLHQSDKLGIHLSTGYEDSSLRSISGFYDIPFYKSESWSLRLFSGFSKTDINNFFSPNFDIEFDEEFYGFSLKWNFYNNQYKKISMNLTRTWREETNELFSARFNVFNSPLIVRSAPIEIGLNYRDKMFDSRNGKTKLNMAFIANWKELGGSSEEESFQNRRFSAKQEYLIIRGKLNRYQLFSLKEGFAFNLKLNGQYSRDTLLNAELITIGGIFSVRGYEENEFAGDSGLDASLELLSPEFHWKNIAIRTISFFDYGYFDMSNPSIGSISYDAIRSGGIGFRLKGASNLYLQCDYGWALKQTLFSDNNGRFHIIATIDF